MSILAVLLLVDLQLKHAMKGFTHLYSSPYPTSHHYTYWLQWLYHNQFKNHSLFYVESSIKSLHFLKFSISLVYHSEQNSSNNTNQSKIKLKKIRIHHFPIGVNYVELKVTKPSY